MKILKIITCALSLTLIACENINVASYIKSATNQNEGLVPDVAKNTLPPLAYVNWVKDQQHGLKREKEIGDIVFSAQYKPIEYVICMEQRSKQISTTVIKQKQAELKDMQYIDFKIGLTKGEGELLKYNLETAAQYNERVNYFSYKMQNDIKLLDGNDTLSCTLFHFERAYDVAPYSTFVLGFPIAKNKSENKTLVYHDHIFKKGIIKLEFENKNIHAVPILETIN